jgi:hypothetical protein
MNLSITDLTTNQQTFIANDIPTRLHKLTENVICLIGGIQ